MQNQAGTRARSHQRHTQQTPAQKRYMSHKRQSPNQAALQASNEHTTLTSHRTLCHRGTRHRGTAPTVGATGTRTAHIQLKPRRRGIPPAPVMKPRHGSTAALGRNKQNVQKLRPSKPRTQPCTLAHSYPPEQAWLSAAGRTPRPAHTGPCERVLCALVACHGSRAQGMDSPLYQCDCKDRLRVTVREQRSMQE